ncbi:hypothetical protein [Streptomyces yangpuensis]|uniref:hypothetical protein n=1 Tax=Streptomyces yangpuensis TaxID=1648182 RepID=UPI00062949C0|nr:hypothetical protein [Streptomyces yangpuensis]
MSRPRPVGRTVLAVLVAVLAVLLGGTVPAAAKTVLPDAGRAGSGTPGALMTAAGHPATGAPGTETAPALDPARAPGAAPGVRAGAGGTTGRAPLRAVQGPPEAPGAPRAAVAVAVRGGGPSCAPAAPDHGGTPAVPARAGGDHAQVPPGRPVPPAARPYAGLPVPAPVRGPDRPAPGPVELSVMRV